MSSFLSRKSLRVCDLTTLYIDGGEGGVNTYLLEKARYLSKDPTTSHVVIVPGERNERRKLFGSTIHSVKSRRLPSNPQHRVLTRFREVERILRDESPDVVEVDCAYLLGRVAATALGESVPVIGFYHVHLPTFIARPRMARFGDLLASTAERWAWRYVDLCQRYCDRLVVTSGDMRLRLGAAGYTGLEQVPLGVNLELFRPRNAEKPSGHPKVILYVGRLSREKDLKTLLNAFSLLTPQKDYCLRIVGDGPTRGSLERQAGNDPRVTFLGTCPYGEELAAHYASADVIAVPSPNETFNLTILEGLASGVPVVAIRQGGPRDLVRPEVGALANPGDARDFAAQLEHTLRAGIRPELCRELVEHNYSWERSFDRLLGVYEEARAQRRALSLPSAS